MSLNYSAEQLAFRQQVQDFLDRALDPKLKERLLSGQHLTKDEYLSVHQLLHTQGWSAPNWPKEFGGPGWDHIHQYLFGEVLEMAGIRLVPFGIKMVAPVIMAFGSKQQQQRFLPKILDGSHWWCQGYSEPGSGSDLASLNTKAERDGDHYVINGQKTWTTLAQFADWMFCLVRTNSQGKAQEGISFVLIDMKTPGVSVRPIITLDGEHEVNEVWFDNVRVPVENRVGEENKGWTYAKFLLGHERSNIAAIGVSKREVIKLKQLAAQVRRGRGSLLEEPGFARRLAEIEIDLMALEITNLRVLASEHPGPAASVLKIKGSEIHQAVSALSMEAAGMAGLRQGPDAVGLSRGAGAYYCNMRKLSIFGGSNEIQKNIIAQMMLKLS